LPVENEPTNATFMRGGRYRLGVRSMAQSIALALLVGVAVVAVGIAIVAMPLYLVARAADPTKGLDDPTVRDGLVGVAIPFGLVIGTVAGVWTGRWYRRGGRLPTE
jgi:hypothetical protein